MKFLVLPSKAMNNIVTFPKYKGTGVRNGFKIHPGWLNLQSAHERSYLSDRVDRNPLYEGYFLIQYKSAFVSINHITIE